MESQGDLAVGGFLAMYRLIPIPGAAVWRSVTGVIILGPRSIQEALIKQKETHRKKQVPPSSSSFVVSLCHPLVAEPDMEQLAKLS